MNPNSHLWYSAHRWEATDHHRHCLRPARYQLEGVHRAQRNLLAVKAQLMKLQNGMNRGPTGCSLRTHMMNGGMAYGGRPLRSRTTHSSRRLGNPSTGRRGGGGSIANKAEVRAMRNAETILAVIRDRGDHYANGHRNEPLESRMLGNVHVRFGGGRLEKCRKATRQSPTLPGNLFWTRSGGCRGTSPQRE